MDHEDLDVYDAALLTSAPENAAGPAYECEGSHPALPAENRRIHDKSVSNGVGAHAEALILPAIELFGEGPATVWRGVRALGSRAL